MLWQAVRKVPQKKIQFEPAVIIRVTVRFNINSESAVICERNGWSNY